MNIGVEGMRSRKRKGTVKFLARINEINDWKRASMGINWQTQSKPNYTLLLCHMLWLAGYFSGSNEETDLYQDKNFISGPLFMLELC